MFSAECYYPVQSVSVQWGVLVFSVECQCSVRVPVFSIECHL